MKQKVGLCFYIMLCSICCCLFLFGIYSAKNVSTMSSGTITFTSPNVLNLEISKTVTGNNGNDIISSSQIIPTQNKQQFVWGGETEHLEFKNTNTPIVMTYKIVNNSTKRNIDFTLTENITSTTNIEHSIDISAVERESGIYNINPKSDGIDNEETIEFTFYLKDNQEIKNIQYDIAINFSVQTIFDSSIEETANIQRVGNVYKVITPMESSTASLLNENITTISSGYSLVDYTVVGTTNYEEGLPSIIDNAIVSPFYVYSSSLESITPNISETVSYLSFGVDETDNLSYVKGNNSSVTEVIIPLAICKNNQLHIIEKIQGTIMNGGFMNYSTLETVKIPISIKVIGAKAFQGCSNLIIDTLPKHVEKIESYAFGRCLKITTFDMTNCKNLKEFNALFVESAYLLNIKLPDNIEVLNGGFSECWDLQTVILPKKLKEIGKESFYSCSELTNLNLPEGLEIIGDKAFYGCKRLNLTSFPNTVTVIGEESFLGCTALALTGLSDTLTSIGASAFSNCNNLALTSLPNSLATINKSAFYSCGKLVLTNLPTSLTTIGSNVFYNCVNLAITSMPDNIITIEKYAFYGCTNLPLTKLSNNLTTIELYAFMGCKKLAITTFPASLTTIGAHAFYQCTGITEVDLSKCVNLTILQGFDYCSGVVSVQLPNGIQTIAKEAFRNCTSLTDINIPDSVTIIEESAFLTCSSLELTELPSKLTTIGASAFYGIILNELTIYNSLTLIGAQAFKNSNLSKITFVGTEEEWNAIGGLANVPSSVQVVFQPNA